MILRGEISLIANAVGDVPVFLDAVTAGESGSVVRCNYLVIESETPLPGWSIKGASGESLPLLLLGLQGIIVSRLDGGKFTSADDVEALFSALEADGLTVEVSDLWLPEFLFKPKHATPIFPQVPAQPDPLAAGAVFRLTTELFTLAFQAREGGLSWDDFASRAIEGQEIAYSAEETGAFAGWHDSIQDAAAEQSPKDAELQLPRREARGMA